MKKIASGRQNISNMGHVLCCPKCKGQLLFGEGNGLFCMGNHCYDLSAKGYVNFLPGGRKEMYTKQSFAHRRNVFDAGFFSEISDQLRHVVSEYLRNSQSNDAVVLDAGCGEGSFLHTLIESIASEGRSVRGVGLDISKEGIALATDYMDHGNVWLVADLARLPVSSRSIDVIINIFAPANYTEFNRVLKKGGMIIKASPGDDHLKEIRKLFYKNTEKREYDGKGVAAHFRNKCESATGKRIAYQVDVNETMLEQIIKMTPLLWHKEEKIDEKSRTLDLVGILKEITVDVNILWEVSNE